MKLSSVITAVVLLQATYALPQKMQGRVKPFEVNRVPKVPVNPSSSSSSPPATSSSTISSTESAPADSSPAVFAEASPPASSSPSSSAVPVSSEAPVTTPVASENKVVSTGKFQGINIAGFDFGCSNTFGCKVNGAVSSIASTPQIKHFAGLGLNTFRLPVGWEYLAPSGPTNIDQSKLTIYDGLVQNCLNAGAAMCIIDLHNYAYYNGAIIGKGGPSHDQFASFWSQIASKYASNPRIAFELMNEPQVTDMADWAAAQQSAINAIRSAGAKTQYILTTGQFSSSAMGYAGNPVTAFGAVEDLTDPSGSDKLVFSLHQYFDDQNGYPTGTSTWCNAAKAQSWASQFEYLATVLNAKGKKAMITELGGGNNQDCVSVLSAVLKTIASNNAFLGGTMWSAGAFDTSYDLGLTPNGNSDTMMVTQALIPAWAT